jgi:hypothetical protein
VAAWHKSTRLYRNKVQLPHDRGEAARYARSCWHAKQIEQCCGAYGILLSRLKNRLGKLGRHFRRIAEPSAREADRESELAQTFTTVLGIFSEGPFGSAVLAD